MIEERISRIQRELAEEEALLVLSVPNRFYLTGFETSDGYVIITKQAAYFLTDFRYIEKAKEVVSACEVQMCTRSLSEIDALLKKHKVAYLYVEAETTSMHMYEKYKEAFAGVEICKDNKMDQLIRTMRAVKTPGEVKLIRDAQKMTDDTFSYILERIEPGRSEIDVMLDMEFYMRRLGSEGISFDFIVVSGRNSSLPHGVPTHKKIEKGDFLTMDFGAVAGGYHSDMTRTVAVGTVDEEQKRVYDTVLTSQLMAIEAAKPGVRGIDVDKVARDYIYGQGYEGCFGHGLGHSVGIEIHEDPNFNTRDLTIIEPGMVITVEPGIYLEGKYGVRIEDMVYITENGCEILTDSEKSLIVL